MNMFLEPFAWILFVFVLVEFHGWLARRRLVPKAGRQTLGQAVRSILPQDKAEFLLPMDDEEYEAHLREESGRAPLVQAIINKLPWTTEPPKSPSSDSSSKKE